MKIVSIPILLALGFGACSTPSPKSGRRVLVIHSYEESAKWYPYLNEKIQESFDRLRTDVEIQTYYLDCEMKRAATELSSMYAYIDSISAWKPEVILVNDDQATYSLLACNHPFLHQVPIVFTGVNYPNEKVLAQYDNVTGFRDSIDFIKNYELIQEIVGKTEVFFFADSTVLDLKIKATKQAVLLEKQNAYEKEHHLPLTRSDDPSLDSILRLSRQRGLIPQIATSSFSYSETRYDWLWRISSYAKLSHYLQVKRDYKVNCIASIFKKESFTAINEAFGYGEQLLGGYFTPLDVQASDAVQAAVRILNGASPSSMPIVDSRKEYQLDWAVMKLFNIQLDDAVLNKYKIVNIDFIEKYSVLCYSLFLCLAVILIVLTIWALSMYLRANKKRAMSLRDLQEEKETLSMAIRGSNTYAWKWEAKQFYFNELFWDTAALSHDNKRLSFLECLSFIHPDDKSKFTSGFNRFDSVNSGTLQIRGNFSGKYEWWEIRYTTFKSTNDTLTTIGLMINIQSHKDHERELEMARDAAAKAELKQSFLANVSHEIRTPLNAIVGFSNLLSDDDQLTKDEREEYIKIINSNNHLLLKLINDVLELSRIESGQMSFNIEEVSTHEILTHVFETNTMLAPKKIEFRNAIDNAHDWIVQGDTLRLTQVLTNFVNNAFKFTASGHVTLGGSYLSATKEVKLYVEDTGIGLDETEQKMIFNRFYKQDEFAQGTGLGLSICKVIAEKLHGRIELTSTLGKGSTFAIILPTAKRRD